MSLLETIISFYGFLSLTHLFIQINLSHADYLKTRKDEFDASYHPRVAIVVPSYNEETKALRDCVQSCIGQEYAGTFKIIVVNDGSKDREGVRAINKEFRNIAPAKKLDAVRKRQKSLAGIRFIDLPRNLGKRHAQKRGFDAVASWADIIVTIDSDTIVHPHALRYIVQKFKDPAIGATTGDVKALKTRKFLSHLIAGRYWMAFHQERSAQSFFGNVLCCSGPLAAYRNSVIQKVK